MSNFWLGCNELVIVFRDGRYFVLERFENYDSVFSGTFEKCYKYCLDREVAYYENEFI